MEDVELIDRSGREDAEVARTRDRSRVARPRVALALRDAVREVAGARQRLHRWSRRDALPWELTAERIRRICEPHFGVGSDGVLLLSPAADERHVAELRIFNPDGSEAELSGNGAREAVLYLRAAGWTDADTFTIIDQGGRGDADDHRPGPGLDGDRAGLDDLAGLPGGPDGRHAGRSASAGATGPFSTSTSATRSA